MDPACVIGISAAAIQFLDFGSKLLSMSYEIYTSPSGQSSKEEALSTVVAELTGLLGQVEQTISTSSSSASPAQNQLLKLCAEATDLIAPLKKTLRHLQKEGAAKLDIAGDEEEASSRPKSVRNAIHLAVKAIWGLAKTDRTIEKLQAMRVRMMAAVLFTLW